MNNNLRKALEANRFHYARMYEAMRPAHEKIRLEQKQILSGLYSEVTEMESRLRAMEAEFGYTYRPSARHCFGKASAGDDSEPWNGTDDGDFDEDDVDQGDVLPGKPVPDPNTQKVPNVANIFIGGAGDKTGNHNVLKSSSLQKDVYGKNYYATYDQRAEINKQIAALPPDTKVNLIGHSYGGDTAAKIAVDNPGRIDTLVTIDPVGQFSRPDFSDVQNSVNTWIDVNATGNPIPTYPDYRNGNLAAELGGKYGDDPANYADIFYPAPYDHIEFDNMVRYSPNSDNPSARDILDRPQ